MLVVYIIGNFWEVSERVLQRIESPSAVPGLVGGGRGGGGGGLPCHVALPGHGCMTEWQEKRGIWKIILSDIAELSGNADC